MSDQGWSIQNLGSLTQIEMGQSPPSEYVTDHASPNSWPFLQGNAEFTEIHPIARLWCRRPAKLALTGDVLISVRAPVGDINVADRDYCIGRGLAAIRFRGVDARFGFHQLALRESQLHRVAQGSTFDAIGSKELRELEFFTPNPSEQHLIAEILDTLDDQILVADKIRAKLGLALAGLTHDVLSAEDIVSIRPLGELAEVASGVTLGHEPTGPGTVSRPYLRVANVQDGHLDLREIKHVRVTLAELARFELKSGDVLMNEGGDADKLGRGAVWQGQIPGCLHQNHVFRVRCDTGKLSPEYLSVVSGSTIGKRYFMSASKQTTNLASINSTQIKAFPIPLRRIERQRSIVDAVRSISTRIEEEQRELAKLRLLKTGLMVDLLTGRVRVPMGAA